MASRLGSAFLFAFNDFQFIVLAIAHFCVPVLIFGCILIVRTCFLVALRPEHGARLRRLQTALYSFLGAMKGIRTEKAGHLLGSRRKGSADQAAARLLLSSLSMHSSHARRMAEASNPSAHQTMSRSATKNNRTAG